MIINVKRLIYYRQHPEAALRYLPIVELLKKLKVDDKKILEVGSGAFGITPYLKRKITGIDFDFSEGETPFLEKVVGKGSNLPFDDSSFDVVILSDVLEHIPKSFRKKTLEEAVRVVKEYVVISGPFGKLPAAQDKLLADYSIKKLGRMHPFFEDHLKYGLPEVSDVEKILMENPKVKAVKIVGKSLNLSVRERLMKVFIAKSKLKFYFYMKGLMPTVPILKKLNKKPCYRTLILVNII